MTLTRLGHEPGSKAEKEWHEAMASAFQRVTSTLYVVVDAYTHKPVEGREPIQGYVGIAADIASAEPGLTAIPADDATPERRAQFADALDRQARFAADYSDMKMAQYEKNGSEKALLRANREAEESDRLSDRAYYVRAALES